MKTALSLALKITAAALLAALLLIALLLALIAVRPAVPNNYTKTVETGGPLEAAFLATGPHKVKYLESEAEAPLGKLQVYYPEDLPRSGGTYPAVIFANGTGVRASKYKALFRHLASWGFIAAGNEDPDSWTGQSSDRTLALLLEENRREDSVLYGRVDLENIGVTGHSQGGVGVFTAVTANEHSGLYKAAVALSPTHEEGAEALGWSYDLAAVRVPTLLLAGTEGDFETQLVIPPEAMARMYDKIDAPKAMARKTGLEHGQTLYGADGYATAWLLWQLKGDQEAGKVFAGDAPELSRNALYQDVRLDID